MATIAICECSDARVLEWSIREGVKNRGGDVIPELASPSYDVPKARHASDGSRMCSLVSH